MNIKRVRDLTVVELNDDQSIVIACDSCGGIGLKEGDSLKVSPFFTGKLTARVALFEVICSGAKVITLADSVCNEMNPTGNEIIKGIKEELKCAGIDDIVLTGSTEENILTVSTALGITVVGIVPSKELKVNKVKNGAIIISIGIPKVGNEVKLEYDNEIASYDLIKRLLFEERVLEIVPVGSKGILYEAKALSENNGFVFKQKDNILVDIKKSAGPSTVIIAAIEEDYSHLIESYHYVNVIGMIMDNKI
jgi:selenophosphate synthetase-related protein